MSDQSVGEDTKHENFSKFSSLEFIDAEDKKAHIDMEPEPKDRNNNGSNDLNKTKQDQSTSQGLQRKLENNKKSSDQQTCPASANSLNVTNISNNSNKVIPLFKNTEPCFDKDQRSIVFSPSSLQPPSSGKKSHLKSIKQGLQFSPVSDQTLSNQIQPQNFNHSNNKKKLLLEKGTKTDLDTDDNEKSEDSSFDCQKRGRFRSVQLSSIRTFSSSRNSKSMGRKGKKHFRYGQRLIEKDGSSNVEITGCKKIDFYQRYISDIFTTVLDSSWSFVLFITSAVYIGHWIIFGILYWLFAIANNDYERIKMLQDPLSNITDPCVYNVFDLTSAFLFSLESETSIGYGFRTITTQCPHAVLCLTLQCLVSAVFDTWVIGMCFARLARPDARTSTTMFSTNAVICKRDGIKCLLIRFANLRKSLLLNVTVRARLISPIAPQYEEKSSGYGKMLKERQVYFHNANCALLTAPIEYCHVIDKDSPFYGIKSETFNSTKKVSYFELIFILTGTLESTGLTMQAQTSYLSSEILYGHRFVPMLSKSYEKGKYVADFKRFNHTIPEMTIDIKSHPMSYCSPPRDISAPLIEETEEEIILTNDDVFSSGYEATITSIL